MVEKDRAFECNQGETRKKIENNRRIAFVEEDHARSSNKPEDGEVLVNKRVLCQSEME